MEEPLKGNIRMIHHSTFLKELAAEGKLRQPETTHGKVTYHDACYLSRYLGSTGVQDPRTFLRYRGHPLIEAGRKGVRSFCCGAGGAQFFNEEDEGERVYRVRTDELLKTECKTIVTSCPFCQAMIRDGLGDRGVEDVEVKDLAQM